MKTKYNDYITEGITNQIRALTTVLEHFELKGYDTIQLKANVRKLKKTLNLYIKSMTLEAVKASPQVSSLNKKNT